MPARVTLSAIVLTAAVAQGPGLPSAPRTVGSVDLTQYVGTYYEIARFPNRFQAQCVGDVTATYSVRPDRRIDVVNRCRTEDATTAEARGVAKQAQGDRSNAKLKVRFAPAWLSIVPKVWGDYWVLGLGPDYSYAVVGDPSREYLWILSRVAPMPEIAYQQALEIGRSNGYDVSRLVKTQQGGW